MSEYHGVVGLSEAVGQLRVPYLLPFSVLLLTEDTMQHVSVPLSSEARAVTY